MSIYTRINGDVGKTTFTFVKSNSLPNDLPISTPISFTFLGNRLLLVKKTSGWWDIVGGKMEEGEDYITTLNREALEEGCVKIHKHTLIGYVHAKTEGDPGRHPPISILPVTCAHIRKVFHPFVINREVEQRELVKLNELVSYFGSRKDNQQLLQMAIYAFEIMSVRRTPSDIIGKRHIRGVALDIDDTILNKLEQIPPEVVNSIRNLIDRNVHIVFCTARSIESTLEVLNNYFLLNELSLFGYVCLGGSHAYRTVCKKGNLVSEAIYAHSYNPEKIYRESIIRDFLRHYPRIIEKATSLVVDIGSLSKTKYYVRILSEKLKSRPVKVYQYHDKVCISLKRFDKDKGLREYLKYMDIPNRLVVRIADQGAPFESDYEFLRSSLGFSVGTRDLSSTTNCHWVYLSTGANVQSIPATVIVLRAIAEV